MASIQPLLPRRYICRPCLRRLVISRRSLHSLLLLQHTRSQSSDDNAPSTPFTEPSMLVIKKHWSTEFRGPFAMTWASRSALHVSTKGENKHVSLTSVRPRGVIRGGEYRWRDGVPPTPPRQPEEPNLPGKYFRRPSRWLRSVDAIDDGGLIPSEPSPPLGARKSDRNAPPAPIYSPEALSTKSSLSLNVKEEFNWYWETLPPKLADKTYANHFFTKHGQNAKLLHSAAQFRFIPESDVPEVAFVGRSNVGKSSLLNAVVSADIKSLLARTSATPGFTKTMNFYGIGPGNGVVVTQLPNGYNKIVGRGGITIVDMPGYGEGSLSSWGVEIMKYVQSRNQLRRVFVLLDANHGIKDKDRSLLASLRLAGVSHQVVMSKLDNIYVPKARTLKRFDGKALTRIRNKTNIEKVRMQMEKIRSEIQPPVGGGALGEILACSAQMIVDGKRLGIDHLRYAILKAVGLDGGRSAPKPDGYHRVSIG